MEITSYEKASDIPNEMFDSLIDAEIECWGSEPFGEFVICKNDECKKIYSIEKVLGDSPDFKKYVFDNLNFCCEACESDTEYMYPKEDFSELFREYFQREVGTILMFDDHDSTKVEGFGVISKTTISELVDMEFATRPGSYNKQELAQTIAKNTYGDESLQNNAIICLHQMYISKKIRKSESFWDALRALCLLHDYTGVPTVLETRFDSRVYPLMRLLGFEDIYSDLHGYTVQSVDNYSNITDYIGKNTLEQQKNNMSLMKKYLREAKKVLNMNPNFKQKTYIG